MARPRELIEGVVGAIQDSGNLPNETNYVGYEPNTETQPIKLPLLEVVAASEARIDEHNTDVQGTIDDSNGNTVGQLFQALYNLTIEVNVWTAHGSQHDPDALGDAVYSALYQYDSAGPGRDLHHDVWRVRVGDGTPDEDFSTSPTLRRWSQEVDLWAYEQFTTDEEYIVNVDSPADGDFGDTSATGEIDNA
jgi:hypothetical protein